MSDQPELNNAQRAGSVPPYVAYRTFINFLQAMDVGIPSHIDKSVLKSLSGGTQSWLKSSLRYMKLIDHDSVPQDLLYQLVAATGEDRKAGLKDLFRATYAFLRPSVDLETTTPAKLESAFVQTGATGETVRKCTAFLIAMAKDAGVELSPHLVKRGAMPRRPRPQRQRNGTVTSNRITDGVTNEQQSSFTKKPMAADWTDQLLGKFPTFDPAWPDEIKVKWFEGFERLMSARKS